MRILFLTDLHGRQASPAELSSLTQDLDLVLVGGDITNFGSPAAAEAVLAPWRNQQIPLFAVPGNLDQPSVAAWLVEGNISLEGTGLIIEQVGVQGSGGSNRTPFNTPLEYSEEELAQQLQAGWLKIEAAATRIVLSHTPPSDTAVDRIASGQHVGSPAVRSFLEEHQPDLCLCGHIHEAAGADTLGETTILNPGAFASGGFATVEIAQGQVSWQLDRL